MQENIIELRGVRKEYDGDLALDDINLTIKNGEFLTLLGPSGCGKTTLLRLLSGFEQADGGDIYIKGANMTHTAPEARHVNMVFQSYALFPHMTVFENVAFGLRCKKTPEAEIKERVQQALSMVKLEKLVNRKPTQLSGGQQQRVAIARAVVMQPWVLLLDEPLSALDYNLRKDMQIELKQLQRRLGITFILVTHDQEEALSMSDRVVVMQEGTIAQVGTPRDVYEKPQSLYVANFIGEVNIFPTEVISGDEKTLQVRIEGKIFHCKNTGNFKTGDKIYVIMRPEDIEVWDKAEIDDSTDMLPGVVEQVIYKGSTVDVIVSLQSGKKISASQFFNEDDERLEYYTGEQVWINWFAGWEVLLPND